MSKMLHAAAFFYFIFFTKLFELNQFNAVCHVAAALFAPTVTAVVTAQL